MAYLRGFGNGSEQTPQTQPILGRSDMVKNEAGGFVWQVDDWVRLDRFLIAGTEGGSYYTNQQKLTRDSAEATIRCIKTDGARVVQRIVEVSTQGLAPKNDTAVFALALVFGFGSIEVKQAAELALTEVCRIATHLFDFNTYVEGFRGRGKIVNRAIGNWYQNRPLAGLAYQTVKYQQRNGVSHRDLLRLTHPATEPGSPRAALYRWAVHGTNPAGDKESSSAHTTAASLRYHLANDDDLAVVYHTEQLWDAARVNDTQHVVQLISEYNLPHEVVPTEMKRLPDVWNALAQHMPITALVRNLANLTRLGLLTQTSDLTRQVVAKLTNQQLLQRGRVHPITLLAALKTYSGGANTFASRQNVQAHKNRHPGVDDVDTKAWAPVGRVVDALNDAFYLSFKAVRPTNKTLVLGIDVSGSMHYAQVNGVPNLSTYEAAAALALMIANTEPNYAVMAFSDRMIDLSITPRQRITDVVKELSKYDGGTNCALPIAWAHKNSIKADGVVILTDNQTWQGTQHPAEAIAQYRRQTQHPTTKLVSVAMTADPHTVVDPSDGGCMNVIGFDTSAVQTLLSFVGSSVKSDAGAENGGEFDQD